MHSAPHRNNSDFQLRHFIAGSCHTADAAWNILYEQMLDIKIKMETTKARLLKREAARLDLEEQKAAIRTRQDELRYKAAKIEYDSGEGMLEMALAGAEKELQTIQSLMKELEPLRKYSHLPILEASEAAQRDEWREEFKHRIENYILSQGTVPHDQIEAMRKHPDFQTEILPHFKECIKIIDQANDRVNMIDLLENKNKMLPKPTDEQNHE